MVRGVVRRAALVGGEGVRARRLQEANVRERRRVQLALDSCAGGAVQFALLRVELLDLQVLEILELCLALGDVLERGCFRFAGMC